MSAIEFRLKNIKSADGTVAALASMSGSIDATTINQFQGVLDKLFDKGVRNLIMDCSNIKYINSTGMGTLLKYVDQFEGAGGALIFCRVPSKVMLVMEMLGFNALFKIVADEAVALKAISGAAVPPANVPVRMEEAPPPPPPPPPPVAPPLQQASIPMPQPSVTPSAPLPVQRLATTAKTAFPRTVACSRCSVDLTVEAVGKYRCPRCGAILDAEASGRVRFFVSKKAKPIQISLPCNPQLAAGVGQLASFAVSSIGGNGTSAEDIATAVTKVCVNVMERGCNSDVSRLLHCQILPQGNQVVIKISDQGTPIEFSGGSIAQDEAFRQAISLVDSVNYQKHPKGGNVFTLTKTIG